MTTLQINEVRSVKFVGGVQTFEVLVTCTNKGDLPDSGIFVQRILNTRNSLQDEFQRIATVADLDAYVSDRDEANREFSELWRSSNLKLTYNDIAVADQAVRILSDRVNTLTNDWKIYQDSFDTIPEGVDYFFPTGDLTYIAEIKATYATQVAVYDAAQAKLLLDTEAYDDAIIALGVANTALTEWTAEQHKIQGGGGEYGVQPYYTFAQDHFDALRDDGAVINTAIDTFAAGLRDIILSPTGGGYLTRLTMNSAGYVSPGAGAIGKPVEVSAVPQGILHFFRDSTYEWWISQPLSFSVGHVVTVDGGGTGTISDSGVVTTVDVPYKVLYDALLLAKTSFNTILSQASLDQDFIDIGATYCDGVGEYTGSIVGDKSDLVAISETAVEQATLAKLEAGTAVTAAYNAVISAYDTVKEVCPDWSPDPPLPPQP